MDVNFSISLPFMFASTLLSHSSPLSKSSLNPSRLYFLFYSFSSHLSRILLSLFFAFATLGEGNWKVNPGDGAFYGPKIDIKVTSTVSTVVLGSVVCHGMVLCSEVCLVQ